MVGPTADDEEALLANYHGTPAHAVTLLEGIRAAARARGATVRYARGATLAGSGGSSAQLREAVTAARRSDVVVAVLGLDPRLEGEENDSALNPAGDRGALGLPASQEKLLEALVATGKPVIVVLTGGSALAVPFAAAHAAALLDAWYPGEEGGNAVADVLFGEANPAGRLPITIYRSVADLPPFADYAMRGRTYRYLDRRRSIASATASRTRRSATPTWPLRRTERRSPSRSRTAARVPATRWSRSTSSLATRPPTPRTSGWRLSRGSRWRRASDGPSR